MMRFSPMSGTTSASVPMAATLTNAGSQPSASGSHAQRLHQLQRHADAGEVLVGIGAVVPLRVDDRERLRQLGVGLVVVGDDQVEPERARVQAPPRRRGCRSPPRSPAVTPSACSRSSDGRLQPVAVAQPLRNEMRDVGAEQFERPAQDHRGRDAVDVVVAVDGDAFLARDGRRGCARRPAPCRRARTGRADRRATARGSAGRRSSSSEAADAQQARGDRRDAAARAARAHRLRVVARERLPDALHHQIRLMLLDNARHSPWPATSR